MLHAKCGELTLEKDFLYGALGKARFLVERNDLPLAQADILGAPGEAYRLQP
jgi:hypothetical protein